MSFKKDFRYKFSELVMHTLILIEDDEAWMGCTDLVWKTLRKYPEIFISRHRSSNHYMICPHLLNHPAIKLSRLDKFFSAKVPLVIKMKKINNRRITPEFVRKYRNKCWNLKSLAENPHFDLTTLKELFPHINEDNYISYITKVSEQDKIELLRKYKKNLYKLRSARWLDLEYILEHFDDKWDIYSVSRRDDVNIQHVLNYDVMWDFDILSMKIPYSDILAHPEIPWEEGLFCSNPTFYPTSEIDLPSVRPEYITFKTAIEYSEFDTYGYNFSFTLEKKINYLKFASEYKVHTLLNLIF